MGTDDGEEGEEEEDAFGGYEEEDYQVQRGEYILSSCMCDANVGMGQYYHRRRPHPLKPAKSTKSAKLPF